MKRSVETKLLSLGEMKFIKQFRIKLIYDSTKQVVGTISF
jgi:hypothetical protein